MTERCPLADGTYWLDEGQERIPGACLAQCGKLIEAAEQTRPIQIIETDEDCDHDLNYGDSSLQRAAGAHRITSALYLCAVSGIEAVAEQFGFECPYN